MELDLDLRTDVLDLDLALCYRTWTWTWTWTWLVMDLLQGCLRSYRISIWISWPVSLTYQHFCPLPGNNSSKRSAAYFFILLCLHQAKLVNGDIVLSTCPSVRPSIRSFVSYQTRYRNILKLILIGPRGGGMKWSTFGVSRSKIVNFAISAHTLTSKQPAPLPPP